jgi:hypothetical protein
MLIETKPVEHILTTCTRSLIKKKGKCWPAITVNDLHDSYKLNYFLEAFLPPLSLPAPFVAVLAPLALLLWAAAAVLTIAGTHQNRYAKKLNAQRTLLSSPQ